MAATAAGVEESFNFSHVTGVFAASGDKDVPGMLAELEPLLDEIVVTRNSSDRAMAPDETAELAAEIFGEDRVRSAPRLDDAIEAAVALADEADEADAEAGPGSGGVLITGSVITAGDARRLLGPAGGELPPEPSASQPSRHSFTAAELS
jgi:dihydrofolate synthase/folylpolyglutamate synthase